jgi:intergrase/recombinase
VYISIVDRDLINQVASSWPVSYYAIRKRLSLHQIGKVRIKELRSYFVSYLRQNNILPEVIDLLQGRLDIRNNIQLSHYFKIADMGKLSKQILAVTENLKSSLLS